MPPLTITVYAAQNSPRLQYVLRWLFAMQPNTDYHLVYEEPVEDFFIAYGKIVPNALCIPDAGLLWETGIQQHTIATGTWQAIPALYTTDTEGYTIPFDLFSAIFFLLSRYEEYYKYTPDKYGRYPATQSIAYQNGWLQRPVIDEWLQQFREVLRIQFGIDIKDPTFIYQPTYDIDIAYSYRYKGRNRTIGAYAKDLLRGNISAIRARTSVLLNKRADPFDSFDKLQQLHTKSGYTPLYFILTAFQATAYDKNISPIHPQMRALIASLAKKGTIGMHPSYYTDTKADVWYNEKRVLEDIARTVIRQSRQHYIKLHLPATYRHLIKNGIAEDYSMGYGTYLGFRAGTGQPFQWYDIEKEQTTSLQVYPFCFMDTTAHYAEHLNAHTAFALLRAMRQRLQQSGSTLITVFHNFSLGDDPEWAGWPEAYEAFVMETR